MNVIFAPIYSLFGLPNWIGISLLLLVLSLPVQQYTQDQSTFNWEQTEQQEHGDSDSEKDTKEKSKEIDSDDFLIESLTINDCSLYHSRLDIEKDFLAQSGIRSIFDPPPEV
jgi:hypothetical protein